MSKIVVTGAAGFIGSHTCDFLLSQGHTVVGIDNFRTGRRENLADAQRNARFRLVENDVAEPKVLTSLAAELSPDAIIHLAALVSVPQSIEDPTLNFRLNAEATQRVIDAAREVRRLQLREGERPAADPLCFRVVFASSAAVYGNNSELPLTEQSETRPISPYGGAKLASEALLLGHAAAYGFTVRCLRYFNVFGPRQDPKSHYSGVISIFSDRLRAGIAPTIFGDGEQTRDFISVHDVARANAIAAMARNIPSGITNICTGIPTSLNRLATFLQNGVPSAPTPIRAAARLGDIRHSVGSPDRARLELGFTHEVSLQEGLSELMANTGS
jgi:UDP-glucose 4-epimerase